MSDDWDDWAADVKARLIPMMSNSDVVLQLVPRGETDIKFAVELGLSIMMDKPILALVHNGTDVPAKLLKVADKVIYYDDLNDIQDEIADFARSAGQ